MFWLIVQFILVFTVYFTIGDKVVVVSSKAINPDIIKKDLEIYRNNLLNENSLKFLTDCYDDENCCRNGDSILCPSYFELVRLFKVNNISISDQIVIEQINKILSSSLSTVNINEFCEKFPSHIPNTSYYGPSHHQEQVLKLLSNQERCKMLCAEIEISSAQKLKPLCAFISWLSEKLNSKKNVKVTTTKTLTDSLESSILKTKPPVLIEKLKNASIKSDAVIENSLKNVSIKSDPVIENSLKNVSIKSDPVIDNSLKNVSIKNDAVINKSLNVVVSSTIKSQSSTQNIIKINQVNNEIKNNPPPTPPIETTTKIVKDVTVKSSNNKNVIDEIPITNNNQNEQNQDQDDSQIKSNGLNKSQQETDTNLLRNEDDLNSYIEDNDSELEINTNTTYKSNLLNQIKNSASAAGGIEEVNDEIERTAIYKENLLSTDPFYEKSGSNFFFYFLVLLFISILMYVVYQNKTKILALLIEGRRSQKTKNRRKSSARYKRLDTTLEEAIISASTGHNTTQIIY